jgi:3-deoxy-D-manno-octulosonic-acid transferase
MFWFAYNVLFAIAFVLLLPRYLARMWRRGGYRRGFLQRLGIYDATLRARLAEKRRVWIHAVSVGEMFVALQFAAEWRRRNPAMAFVLTTTTSTGHRIAESRLAPCDVLVYFPADFPFVVRRVLRMLRPLCLVLTEGDLWPNLVRLAQRNGVPIAVVNGRMSGSSFRGYRLLGPVFRRVLSGITLYLAQSDADRDRVIRLGGDESRVVVAGSAKYDAEDADRQVSRAAQGLLESCGFTVPVFILVGGSTWPGEEAALLRLCRRLRDRGKKVGLVLAPRHVERSQDVESEVRKAGFRCVRRSQFGAAGERPSASAAGDKDFPVFLVDTTGELRDFYACADAIFVGKSLTRHGGQNIIEAAALGKPVVVGPHTENFAGVVEDLLGDKAMAQVSHEEELESCIEALIEDESRRQDLGRRAREAVVSRRGVVVRSLDLMERFGFGPGAEAPSGGCAASGPV